MGMTSRSAQELDKMNSESDVPIMKIVSLHLTSHSTKILFIAGPVQRKADFWTS